MVFSPLVHSAERITPIPDAPKPIQRIVVDRNLCIGAASCVIVAPGVFELDAENKAIIKRPNTKDSESTRRAELADSTVDDATILNAAKSCPTRAILLYDDNDQPIPL